LTQPTTDATFLDWHKLSRRGFLLAGVAIPILKGQAGSPSCVLTNEQEEGPYYIDGATLRRDITEGKPGVSVTLRVALVDAKRCTPLSNAAIDVWHCDAGGTYSGFTAESREAGGGRGPRGGRGGPPPGPPPPGPPPLEPGENQAQALAPRMPPPPPGGRGRRNVDATRFLRGVQITNEKGMVEFTTLYPGWYEGRAIHIHLKAHFGGSAADKYAGGHVSHTGQLFFPEDLTERIAGMQPYAKRLSIHRTTQQEDGVFRSQHGSSSMVQIERIGNSAAPDGFLATVTLAVDPELTPRPVGGPGRGPGGPPPF